MFKKKPAVEIDAVLDEDLKDLLQELSVYEKLNAEEYNCIICKKKITINNIGLILPRSNEITFVCDEPSCLLEYAIGE